MSRGVVALACIAALVACKQQKVDECTGLVAAAQEAHASVTGAQATPVHLSLKDQGGNATRLANAAGSANDSMRAFAGTLAAPALRQLTAAYADVLEDMSEAARALPPLTQKLVTLDLAIRGNQAATLWATALTQADALQQRCKASPPPHACAYVLPRIAPLESLSTDPDGLEKLARALEGAPRDDQPFEVDLYNFQGTIRVAATSLRAGTNETLEKHAVEADLAVAKAKLDAALAREPDAEAAVEKACTP